MQMANFLDSRVIPGDPVPKHHHRKLLVILTILVLFALIVLVYLIYGNKDISSKFEYVSSTKVDQTVEMLNKNAAPLNESQKLEYSDLLKKTAKPMTNIEKQEAAELLKKLSK